MSLWKDDSLNVLNKNQILNYELYDFCCSNYKHLIFLLPFWTNHQTLCWRIAVCVAPYKCWFLGLTFHFLVLHCGITAVRRLLWYSDTEHRSVWQYINIFLKELVPTSSLSLPYTHHKWTCKLQNSGESHAQLTNKWCISKSARLLEKACYILL